jgi:hypothetical protein
LGREGAKVGSSSAIQTLLLQRGQFCSWRRAGAVVEELILSHETIFECKDAKAHLTFSDALCRQL